MKVCTCDSLVKVRLSSINKKLCGDCSGYSEWSIKQGEESTLINRRKNAGHKRVSKGALVRSPS